MMFENEKEMDKLAEAIARGMLKLKSAEEIVQLAENYAKDAGRKGLLGGARISSEDARLALNELHFAVNGIRPYADGAELDARNS